MRGLRRLRSLAEGRRGVWAAVTALLVLAGTLASVLGARAVAHSDADKARLALHLSSAEVASTLKLAIQHEEDLVVSASAFVTSNPNASAADFDRWAESVHAMQRYPELQNFGLVMLVGASRLAAFEARMAADPLRDPWDRNRLPRREASRSCHRAIAPTTASRWPDLQGTPQATCLRAWTTARSPAR
jgi:CHASE1-domain containing sensor protein